MYDNYYNKINKYNCLLNSLIKYVVFVYFHKHEVEVEEDDRNWTCLEMRSRVWDEVISSSCREISVLLPVQFITQTYLHKELPLFGSRIEILRYILGGHLGEIVTVSVHKMLSNVTLHDVIWFATPATKTLAASLLKLVKTFNHSFRSLTQWYLWNHISDVKSTRMTALWQFLASFLLSLRVTAMMCLMTKCKQSYFIEH